MDIKECIKTRRSIRRFKDEVVDVSLIKEAIQLASYAPSWKNSETTRYYLIQDKSKILEIAKNYTMGFDWNRDILLGCANLLVIAGKKYISGANRNGEYETNKGDGFTMFDAGLATEALVLALHDKGISSVILGIFDPVGVEKYLNMPSDEEAIVLLPLGYSNEAPDAPKRRELQKILKII